MSAQQQHLHQQEEAVNRLVNAFRKELDSYAHRFLDEDEEAAAAAARSSSKRVVVDENPRYFASRSRSEDTEEAAGGGGGGVPIDDEPKPVQTPHATRSASHLASPPLSVGGALAVTSSSSLHWKDNLNAIVDTIEALQAQVASLQDDKAALQDKVDTLTHDYAALQHDYQDLKQRQLQSALDEAEELQRGMDELRQQTDADRALWQSEMHDLREQLRLARDERDKVEQQNVKLHNILEGTTTTATTSSSRGATTTGRSYSSTDNGGGVESSTSYRRRGGDNGTGLASSSNNNGNTSSSTRRLYTDERRTAAASRSTRTSPGEELVRDLTEKTDLDQEYLQPLSGILDRRLGRDGTAARSNNKGVAGTPSRGGGGYSS